MTRINRLYTAKKDVPDVRDHVAAPPALASLPSEVALAAWLPPVRDQGNEGACTMFAGSGMLAWLTKRFTGKDVEFSPQFGYRAERILEGDLNQDGGAQSRTMMKVLATYGLCLETSDPYNDQGWRNQTSSAQLAEARTYRIGAYHRVPDLQTLKSVIVSGYVASLAIEVYESFESEEVARTGIVPVPNYRKEQCLGGHEVYCFGYDDRTGAILCRNSWGEDWGQGGNFLLPYGYWPFVSDSWTCHFGKPWAWVQTPRAAEPAANGAPLNTFFFEHRDDVPGRLEHLERTTNQILERIIAMAETVQQEDDQITLVEQKLAKLSTDLTQGLADLKAAQPSIDTTPEFSRLVAIAASLDTADTAITAADPGKPPAPVAGS